MIAISGTFLFDPVDSPRVLLNSLKTWNILVSYKGDLLWTPYIRPSGNMCCFTLNHISHVKYKIQQNKSEDTSGLLNDS